MCRKLKYNILGNTDLSVSQIGFGVWTISTNWWRHVTEEQGINLLAQGFELGINFYDTADIYGLGYGEKIMSKALKDKRHDIIIATKAGFDIYKKDPLNVSASYDMNFTSNYINYACEQSLKRLETDYIDLYQIYAPSINHVDYHELLYLLDELVREGKIRHYGLVIGKEFNSFEELADITKNHRGFTIQIVHNLMESDHIHAISEIVQDQNFSLITREPHVYGLFDGNYRISSLNRTLDDIDPVDFDWLESLRPRVDDLMTLTSDMEATIAQMAIKYSLDRPLVSSVLPNILSVSDLCEFTSMVEADTASDELMESLSKFDSS